MDLLAKPLARILAIVAVVALVAVIVALNSCQRTQAAKTETRLATGQTGAALDSGRDAVGTLGNASAREDTITETGKANEHAIRETPGADVALDPALNRVGARGLCRYAANRRKPQCVQPAHP